MTDRGLVNATTSPTLQRLHVDETTIQAMTRRARVERLRDALPPPHRQLSFHEQTITERGPHQGQQGPRLDLP